MKKKKHNAKILNLTVLGSLVLGVLVSVFGMSQTVTNIKDEAISATPEAILASAGVEDGTEISLPVVYVDQRMDECVNLYDLSTKNQLEERQFEWSSCGYDRSEVEQGLVAYELGANYLPVLVRGNFIPNRGLGNAERWFEAVEGKSEEYTGTFILKYQTKETTEFSFSSEKFYPIDGTEFSKGDAVNRDGHNHLFTMNLTLPVKVMANGEEDFTITADDDTFVFIGNKLAIDMGGVHEATTGRFEIRENGDVYTGMNGEELAYSGITVGKDQDSAVRIFHADRDAKESVFAMQVRGMKPNAINTQMAGADGVQVAYDPNDPSYIAPLGESSTFRPDGTRGYMVMMMVFGVAAVVFAVLVVLFSHYVIKKKTMREVSASEELEEEKAKILAQSQEVLNKQKEK